MALRVLYLTDRGIKTDVLIADGCSVKPGDVVFKAFGKCRSLLTAERTLLNYMQRMSGIATQTALYVGRIAGTHARLLDTRKTTPNNRIFEKMAVAIGGGCNHRMGLYDMIMIKDNHVDFAGGIENAIDATHHYLMREKLDLQIEIEVRNFDELCRVLKKGGVHRIMLDNFNPANLANAVKQIGGRFQTEASGGIKLENIREFAETGVDFISVGAITHQVHSLDLSLKAEF